MATAAYIRPLIDTDYPAVVTYVDNKPFWEKGYSGIEETYCLMRTVDVSTTLSQSLLMQQLREFGYNVNNIDVLQFVFGNIELKTVLKKIAKVLMSYFPDATLELWLFHNQEENSKTLTVRVGHNLSPENAVSREFELFSSPGFSDLYLSAKGKICLMF